MKNLHATSRVVIPTLTTPQLFCIDTENEGIWIVGNKTIYFVDSNGKINHNLDLVDLGHVTDDDTVVGVDHLADVGVVCIGMRKGDVLTCGTITGEIECVGCVSDGIVCMSWSPYQDLVVMVTGSDNLLLMTREFDPINEVSLYPKEFGKANPITVGWGKKETQFHGSLGKPSQVSAPQSIDPAGVNDDKLPRISWKSDGLYFAVSAIEPSTSSRLLRVWSNELVLHSTSEITNGLGQSIDWSPSGNLIASTQIKPHRYDVIFYEPNGLRHGEFNLNVEKAKWKVKELFWNNNSTILGVWLTRNDDMSSDSLIQLWYRNNYHWYLKQQLHPTRTATPTDSTLSLISAIWDPIVPLRLHLLLSNGQYMIYNWKWSIFQSTSLAISNNSTVAVIDGLNVLLTSLRKVIVPPPMSGSKCIFPSPVTMVTFAPPPNTDDFAALLADGGVAFVEGGVVREPQMINTRFDNLRQIVWWKQDKLLGVTCQSCDQSCDPSVDYIVEFDIVEGIIQEKSHIACESRVLCLYGNADTHSAVIEFTDGANYKYESGAISPWLSSNGDHVTFGNVSCDQIALTVIQRKECLVGLSTSTHQLFIDNTLISSKCTSFGVHNQYVIFTTNSHTIEFISCHSDPSNPVIEDSRNIERGSLIVSVVPHDIKVILQMPRGNLEAITPRVLVLSLVRSLLDKLKFREAFLLMRKHRINMNLICDHNIQQFLSHSMLFVKELNDSTFINLFLSELRDDDITQSMYPYPMWYESQSSDGLGEYGYQSKVNLVCDSVRKALVEVERNKYILSIITTHIRKVPQELEEILHVIKSVRDNLDTNCISVDEILKYTLIFIDVNQLYDAALGLYDFTLVLTVAEKSQKDPKEYLPFLNELRQLPVYYQRYKIDRYLKRYEKALHSISHCMPDKFDECIELIEENKLYKTALSIFSDKKTQEYHVIGTKYGEYLYSKGNFKEAGIVYQNCGELLLALSSFEKADQWELVFVVSAQLGHSIEKRKEIAKRISNNLKSQGQHLAAAEILFEYCEDIEGGIEALIMGGAWKKSLRYIYLYTKIELIDFMLKPALIEACNNNLLLLETQKEFFERHCNRLSIVREEKKKKIEAIVDGTYAVDERDIDLFSDTSSITGQSVASSSHISRATRTSAKSAKNRRKAERKKHSLKEGSENEDMALLEAIKDIVTSANKLQDDIGDLLSMMCFFQITDEAVYLQDKFTLFLEAINNRICEVWPPVAKPTHPVTGPQSTVHSILASLKSGATPVNMSDLNFEVMTPPALRMDMSWKLTNCL